MANENLGGLNIPIGADPSGLRNGMDEAVNIIERSSERINSSLGRIGNIGESLAKLGTVLSASVTVPLVALATASVKAYGDIQALQKGLEAAAGSANYASKQFEDLKEVAKLPGLGLKEAVKGSINLQAIGLSAGKSEKILLQFGNAIASVGKGRVEFERAIYGISQLANTEFPLGEDLNIVADALPQVRTLLKDTFGATRSDDLKKMGVSSKQILDAILTGLEKLPRVNGGIKNAFENLGDSMQQNLSRIGKSIDDNFDISGLIDKLTSAIDKVLTKFEKLSPPVQELVLIFAALAAGTGPVLLGLGGMLAVLPTIANGFIALRTAVIALNTAMLTNPYLAAGAALLYLGSAFLIYRSSIETATERQERWNDSLQEARARASQEIASLDTLYKKTQDHSVAIEERNKAIDQIQKEYPYYFGNLTNEAILAGKAANSYNSLRKAILNASLARAAQKELDARAESSLERELTARKKLTALIGIQNSTSSNAIKQYIKDYENALTTSEKLLGGVANPFANSAFEDDDVIRNNAKRAARNILKTFGNEIKDANKENSPLLQILKNGMQDIENLDVSAPDNIIEGIAKVKKETEKQLSEIFPIGSIAELRQRADLLTKAIETSVNGIVKIRNLDKFGKDTDKQGNPYFTGEIINLEIAYERLKELQFLIGDIDLEPAKISSKGFLDSFGQEFKTLNDLMFSQTIRLNNILGTQIPQVINDGAYKALEASLVYQKALEDLNEGLNSAFKGGISDSISDAFASVGSALATGNDLFKSLGNTLLSSFGSILSQLGKQMIQYGVGLLAIKIAMKSLNPYVAIAAGAALVALGAGLTASVSQQSNNIGGGSSGSVSTTTGANTPNYSSSNFTSGNGSGGEYVFRLSGPDLIATFNRNVQAGDRVSAG